MVESRWVDERAQQAEFHFGTQLPYEPGVQRITVTLCGADQEVVLFDGSPAEATPRPDLPPVPVSKTTRLLRFAGRACRSIVTGEILSLRRWIARIQRFREKAIHLRLKIEQKLLARQHRPRSPYAGYVAHSALTDRDVELRRRLAASFAYRPTISILMPVYNVDPVWLTKAIDSVRAQIYDRWELCLADDASTRDDLRALLDRGFDDPRIKLVRRKENGHICHATNSAAELATGEFIALMDNDDVLACDALWEVVRLLQQHPDADLIYSDEDKIDETDVRFDPQFKPDWSPELLLSYNYINHFTCIRRSVFEAAGRFRPGYEGSQDHDLLLRVVDRTDRIHHLPRILYHWRALASSTAKAAEVKPIVHTSGRKARLDWLTRHQIQATPYVPPVAQRLKLPIDQFDFPDDGPSVGIVLLVESASQRLLDCLEALHGKTSYRNFRIVVGWDRGTEEACRHAVRDFAQRRGLLVECVVVTAEGQANQAERLNHLARTLTTDLILFLDPALKPTEPKWLSRLVGYLSLPGVGVTGGRILDHANRLVHAGVLLGMRDGIAPAHAFYGWPADEVSYYFLAEVARTVSAVSGACLLTTRELFDRLHGFDASAFGETLFDVDFCLRASQQQRRSVYVAGAELRQETPSRDRNDLPTELRTWHARYGRCRDRYYNPNLSDRFSFRPNCDAFDDLLPLTAVPPIRTLVVSHNLQHAEGAPRYLFEIVEGLLRRGRVQATLFSPIPGPGEAVCRQMGLPVRIGHWSENSRLVDGQWSPIEYARVLEKSRQLLRQERPEVVIVNTLCCFPIIEAAAREGIPSLWIIHESYSSTHLARLFSPYGKARCEAAFALASRVIPASHDTAQLFAHLNTRGNFRVLHNGIDASDFDAYMRAVSKEQAAALIPASGGRKRIVAVGTVCERKGQHTLIEAAARLKHHRDDFCIYLVGVRDHIPYANYVRHLVHAHGLQANVHLITETNDVRPFLRAADIFACTSYMETFSRAVLEAEAFGLPFVTTSCCGLNEQVWWGVNALHYDMGNADDLANQLDRLLSDDGLLQRLAVQSRAGFEVHLSYEEMLDRYETLLLQAVRPYRRAIPLPAVIPNPTVNLSTFRKAA